MKILKRIFLVLILFIVVAAVAIVALINFIDPNKLKPLIAQEITKKTDYQVSIEGNLSWSFYPRIGVKAGRITLSEPGKPVFADLRGVLIAADFMQALRAQQGQPLQGNVYIASVRLINLQLTKVNVGLNWQNNILTIKPITATLYNGKLKGEAQGSQLSNLPRWDWNVECDNIQLKPLLLDLNNGNAKLNVVGAGNVSMQAMTQGKNKQELMNYVNGTLQFNIADGSVEGLDLNYLIQTAQAIINKQPIPMPDNANQTKFESLTGSAIIKNGVATTNNLLLLAKSFTSKGEGEFNIPMQTMDYHLQVAFLQEGKEQLMVPISVAGTLSNPSVKIDASMLKAAITEEQLKKVKLKVQEEIKKLPEKADKILKKLIGE